MHETPVAILESGHGRPHSAMASCSRKIPMICSSVNLDRLIVRLLWGYGL